MIRATSIAAYRELKERGLDQSQRALIIVAVASQANMTRKEIQDYLRVHMDRYVDTGTISARMKELKDAGIIVEEVLPRKCTRSHVTVNPVRIADGQIQ